LLISRCRSQADAMAVQPASPEHSEEKNRPGDSLPPGRFLIFAAASPPPADLRWRSVEVLRLGKMRRASG